MGLLRFLSLPVDDVWFSAILLILVRPGGKDGKGRERMEGCWAAWCFYYRSLTAQSVVCFGITLENMVLVKRHFAVGRA